MNARFPYQLRYRTESQVRRGLLVRSLSGGWGEIAQVPGWKVLPAIRFGKDSALRPLTPPASVPSSALLMGAAKEILQQAKQASGCTHAKLKMRALSLDEAAGLIVELKSSFCLRLDAPGTWDVRRLLARFDPSDYDYIEDPPDPAHFPFPFALDQALCRPLPEGVWRNPALRALVLKPTLLGRATERWAAVGRSRGLDVVLGSSFESGVGLSHIASLWKRLALPDVPLGLGTYAFLEQDVLRTPLTFQGGRLHFPQKIDVDDRQLARR